jgi:hypothetical protein
VAWDFPVFYTAGKLDPAWLYREDVQQSEERRLWESTLSGLRGYSFAAFLRPAYYHLLLAPLARLSFWPAFFLWTIVQCASLAVALAILGRGNRWNPALYLLLPVCPYVVRALTWGQDTALVFLAVVVSFELLRCDREAAAGVVLALALVKWNIVWPAPLLLLLQRRWRFAGAFLLAAAVELGVSAALVGRSGIHDYLAMLRSEHADYLSRGMPSLRGLLLAADLPNTAAAAASGIAALATLWSLIRLPAAPAFAGAAGASAALSYHTMIYDPIFLLLPLLVFRKRLQSGWRGAATALVLSPIPVLLGEAVTAAGVVVFAALAVEAARAEPGSTAGHNGR